MGNDVTLFYILSCTMATGIASVLLLLFTPIKTFDQITRISLLYLFSFFPLVTLCIFLVMIQKLFLLKESILLPLGFIVAICSSWTIYKGVVWRRGGRRHLYQNKLFLLNILIWVLLSFFYERFQFQEHQWLNLIGMANILVLSVMTIIKLRDRKLENPGEKLISMSLLVKSGSLIVIYGVLVSTDDYLLHVTNLSLALNMNIVLLLGSVYTMFLFDRIAVHKNEARTDFLTGIFNRRAFMDTMKERFESPRKMAATDSADLGVIVVCDIDRFKNINDTYGHDIGDIAIQSMAKTFKKTLRDKDLYARMGGEEFAIYISDANTESALTIIDRLRKKVEDLEVVVGNECIKFTASFGYAPVDKSYSLDAILQQADHAMYDAKSTGRNKVCLYKANATEVERKT